MGRCRRPAATAIILTAAMSAVGSNVGCSTERLGQPAVAHPGSADTDDPPPAGAPSTGRASPATTAATTGPATTVPATTLPATTVPATTLPATTVFATTLPVTTTRSVSATTIVPATSEPATGTAPVTSVPATGARVPPETSPRRITMAFTGDILPHSPLWRQARRNAAASGREGHDFAPMLAGLRPVLDRADLAVCHLETPIAPHGEAFTTTPYYGVPAEIAVAIADAGYDRCSTASNHTADRGIAGIEQTIDALEQAGVAQSGMARRPEEIEPAVFEVNGIAVSHLSYTWSYNGLALPDDQPWRSALIDPQRILRDAQRARELGAALVVVSLHWGAEGVHAPTAYQRDIAELITAPGLIDLVVGHHAHVLQPIEQVNGTWVVFGLGNVLSNLPTSDRWPAASQDAAVVTVGAVVDAEGRAVVERPVATATWVDREAGWIVRLVDAELDRGDLGAGQRGRLEASRARTAAVLGDHLAAPPPDAS